MRLSSRIQDQMRNTKYFTGWTSLALAVALSTGWRLQALADDVDLGLFPYRAVVLEDQAPVQSGPGDDFYATDRLRKGVHVEVYRIDVEGWLAIRPPQDSFSWVAAEHVELTESGTRARVINVPAKTRVGSRFSDVHDVEYISLHEGELLELIGTKMLSVSEGDPPKRWFRIAPPAGEFRWIQSSQVARIERASSPKSGATVGTEAIKTFDLAGKTKHQDLKVAPETVAMDKQLAKLRPTPPQTIETKQLAVQPAALKSAAASRKDSGFRAVPDSEPGIHQVSYDAAAQTKPHGRTATELDRISAVAEQAPAIKAASGDVRHVNPVTWEAVGAPNNPLSAPEPRSFADSYGTLNIMLSQAVLGDIDTWKLDKVERQTQLLLDSATSGKESELARGLLAKTKEFQQLQRRKQQVVTDPMVALASYDARDLQKSSNEPGRLPDVTVDSSTMPTGPEMPKRLPKSRPKVAERRAPNLQPNEALDNSIFDATGTLIAVLTRRSGMPRYALTDSSGQITRFVSMGDGTSLDHLVNSQVGILGEIGLLRELNKSHVVAIKVVKLKR